MDNHTFPYWSLFKSEISDLSKPDPDGWATGRCPYCGERDTFRVNLKSGRWVCLPPTSDHTSQQPISRKSRSLSENKPAHSRQQSIPETKRLADSSDFESAGSILPRALGLIGSQPETEGGNEGPSR
jgi:hypothetical protein